MLECKVFAAEDLRVSTCHAATRPRRVLVRLGAAGICGSDMHYYFHAASAASRSASR